MYKIIILMILNLLSFSAVANCNKSNVYESISCYEKELRSSKTLLTLLCSTCTKHSIEKAN